MTNFLDKKIIPTFIQIIFIAVGVLCVLMVFDLPPMSPYEKSLLKQFILYLLIFSGVSLVLRKPLDKIKRGLSEKGLGSVNPREVEVPEEFNIEVVKSKGFSFCYPKTWFLTAANDPNLYKEAREQMVEPGILGARNFNISYHDIRLAPDLDRMYKAIIDGVLIALKGSKFEFKQNFKTERFIGMRYKVIYRNFQGLDLSCYQVVLTSHRKKNMLIFTFTSQVKDFDRSKILFDKIADLTRIFD